ncbi:MAG: zinc-dependent alcohol dehydrogenase family protein [Bacteroidia bacterium]|nr:zinc-dependent alcohol dehydrogenase family protein [Bacteroidia bacterium]
MKAFLLDRIYDLTKETISLKPAEIPVPVLSDNEILVKVKASGVCHTELDEISGRTPPAFFPIILGHQVVGEIDAINSVKPKFSLGDRVGIAWIFSTCGKCNFCLSGRENLCEHYTATGRDAHGGYAEYIKISHDFAYKIPDSFSDAQAAPLLCAGAIGFRSLMLTGLLDGQNLGLTGFGASAHLVLKLALNLYPNSKIYVFARFPEERKFALELGACWAGDTTDSVPVRLDAIIDTTPAWKPVVEACANLIPGGRLVINAIRKESFDQDYLKNLNYEKHLWLEKEIKSVANVTRKDVIEFIKLAEKYNIKPDIEQYRFGDVNAALNDLLHKKKKGAKVLLL